MKRTALIILISISFTDVFSQTNTFPDSGNVGIGTTSPNYTLEVKGSIRVSSDNIPFYSPTNGREWMISTGSASIDYYPVNGEAAMINRNSSASLIINPGGGNLMVGYPAFSTTSYKLDINGNTHITGSLFTGNSVGIGTKTPQGALQIMNPSAGFDGYNTIYLTNDNTSYGRTNLILTGRLTNGNDTWRFGSGARNSIVFNVNSAAVGANVGAIGSEYYSIQLEENSKSLGFLSSQNGASPNMVLLQNGNIGIGTASPQSKLAVAGTVTAKQVTVTQTGWPDYVFDSAYHLPSLLTTETFIKKNHHLPNMPSAQKIESKGLNLGDMEKKQMQKIEELTLYLIRTEKSINELKNQNEKLQGEIKENMQTQTALEKEVNQLKNK